MYFSLRPLRQGTLINVVWRTIAGTNFPGDLNHWGQELAFWSLMFPIAFAEQVLAKRTMLPFRAIDGVLMAKTVVGQNCYELRWWCATQSDGTWLPLTEIESPLVPSDETLASITEHIIVLSVFKNGVPSFHRSAESRHFVNGAQAQSTGESLLRKLLNLT